MLKLLQERYLIKSSSFITFLYSSRLVLDLGQYLMVLFEELKVFVTRNCSHPLLLDTNRRLRCNSATEYNIGVCSRLLL